MAVRQKGAAALVAQTRYDEGLVVWVAAMQAELGETAVTGVVSVSVSEEGSEAHFEAFQASCYLEMSSP